MHTIYRGINQRLGEGFIQTQTVSLDWRTIARFKLSVL